MSNEKVLKTFLFDVTEEPKSIYPFAPVYKVVSLTLLKIRFHRLKMQ